MVDLSGEQRPVPRGALRAMAEAIFHRGPDEDGFLERPGVGFASRRLSIVGLLDGRQPITNEDGSVAVVFNGELFDYPEQVSLLRGRGHRFATHCDTEVIPHRWEDHQEEMFEHLRGQFALALHDARRRQVIIARDRLGISPLHWTVQKDSEGEWLLFASEIKALLASGMVPVRPDPRGLNHLFTFFSIPGPCTCFQGIQALMPGHYLRIDLGSSPARVSNRTYWEVDFPDRGEEDHRSTPEQLEKEFNNLLLQAVTRRLRADVPVVSYLSGGVDSSTVVALATHIRKEPIPSFTIRIKAPKLDETIQAAVAARHIGTDPIIVDCGSDEILQTYPELISAAESPVIDTSCAAMLLLAREVHQRGYKVALNGEGADELMAGYPWHKTNRILSWLDVIPGMRVSQWIRKAAFWLEKAPRFPENKKVRAQQAVGGHNGWLDLYGLVGLSKLRFFSAALKEELADHVPFEDIGLNQEKLRRWHPLNRELYVGARIHLPGHQLNDKGDRMIMNSSVEARYPFLDEAVVDFLSRVPPSYKLRGLRDKYILRRVAHRWLPKSIAWRRKAMFRAPFDCFRLEKSDGGKNSANPSHPAFVEQLLSEESLQRTGYFDPEAVHHWRQAVLALPSWGYQRTSVEMGLMGVLATQLWHHTFIDGTLADLPSRAGQPPAAAWNDEPFSSSRKSIPQAL